ncbi:kinase-like domain-containing protein [Pilaira anomala]|nr:kinase-like domain-containing protein [Pilaira anomala]
MSANIRQRQIGDYLISSTIGHGSSGRVKLGIHQITGQKVAIKIIPRSQLNSSIKITRSVERELAVLQLLHHPNLIDLHQVLQDQQNVYFVTEYVTGGELFYFINNKGRLSESEAKNIFVQIAKALSWCHARNICHRDLKPENILLDQDQKSIKIADFGMATMQPPNALLKTSCGSPHYVSPEIIKGIPYYGPSADVWSAGIILYILLTGSLPFDDHHVGRLLTKIKSGRFKKIPDWLSPSARDLIYRILVVDPTQRISFNDILSHPWLFSNTTTTTTVYTNMLSIHSLSLQSNPWHDEQLNQPLISNSGDLYGPTKKTLEVLWRDLTNDQIVSALKEKNPNLQKLTYQLLQQRLKRQLDLVERSTESIEKLKSVCNTVELNSPSSCSNQVETCDKQIEDDYNKSSFYLKQVHNNTCSPIFYLPQTEPNRRPNTNKPTTLNTAISACIKLYPTCTPLPSINNRLVHSKKLPTTHITYLLSYYSSNQTYISSPASTNTLLQNHCISTATSNTQNSLPSHHQSSIKRFIQNKYNIFLSAFFNTKKTTKNRSQPTMIRQEFTIRCNAKSEFIAAGKLNHILSDHFQGKLDGCMFPDGKILWSGEIEKTCFMRNQHYKQTKTCFLCKVRIVSDRKSLYNLVFIIHREDPDLVSTFANRLLELLALYEKDSEEVMKANRWIR